MSLKKTQTRKLVLPHPKNGLLLKLTATVVFGLTVLLSSFGNTAQAQGCSGFDAGFTVNQHDSYLVGPEVRFVNTNRSKRYNYKWYMGDGTVITDSTDRYHPSSDTNYRYKNYGKYQVCHVVESRNCYDSTCKMVNITCDTTINFTGRPWSNNLNYRFNADYADSFVWKFGDGTKQTGTGYKAENPVHTYSKPGSYKVTVKAFRGPNNNCVATEQLTINACDADANFWVQGNGFQRTFKPDNNTANSYSWDFGDGTTSTKANPSHTYSNPGTYQVTLIAIGSNNCADTQTKQVTIRCNKVAGFGIQGNGFQRKFSANGNTSSYFWDFGDGTTSKKANPTHTYGKPGTYQVTLIVKDSICADTQTKQVTIRCNKVAGFGIQGNGFQRKFSARQNTSSYSWDFGDGTTSTKANPTHTYSDTGTYQVTLIANGSNCADTQTKQVTIRCRADAGFTISSLDNERDFDANERANSASSTYHWDFGDGSTDTGAYVRNTYSRKDTYDVQLVVKDGPGCADTNTRQVVIGNSNSINGQIALQQGPSNRIDSLVVELYHYDSCKGVYNQIRSKTTLYQKDSAYYDFDSLPPGKFHVKADPSRDSNLSGKYVATYHQKATNWSNADSIVISGLGKYTDRNDITLQKTTNTSGSGNITGYVGGSKANCTNKRRPEDGPLANVPVLLLNKNREPLARTSTDEEGNYQFNDLALNTYYVRVDLPGYQAKAEEVTLSSDQPKEEADFEVSNEQVTPQKSTGLAEEATPKATVELYPVPSRSQVTVTISDAEAEQLALRVTNMQGQLMAQQRLSASGQQQDIQLDVSDWQSGAYILQLRDQHGQVKEARKLMVR